MLLPSCAFPLCSYRITATGCVSCQNERIPFFLCIWRQNSLTKCWCLTTSECLWVGFTNRSKLKTKLMFNLKVHYSVVKKINSNLFSMFSGLSLASLSNEALEDVGKWTSSLDWNKTVRKIAKKEEKITIIDLYRHECNKCNLSPCIWGQSCIHSLNCVFVSWCFPASALWVLLTTDTTVMKKKEPFCLQNLNLCPQCLKSEIFYFC